MDVQQYPMKLSCLPILLFLLIIIGCTHKEKITTPEEYTALYINKALVIDGVLSEVQWESAKWSALFVDIESDDKPAPPLKTSMKMLWDKHYLYIAAHLEETHLWSTLTEKDAIIYRENDFEVFIDPDGDGLNYYELEINTLGTILDLFLNKPYNQKGKADLKWDFVGLKSAVSLQGSLNDPADQDSSWVVEIAIPWTSFSANSGRPPANGDQWRINFSRVQWDLETAGGEYLKMNLPEHNWVWSPQGEVNMHIPGMWGYLNFEGRADEELKDTPVFWLWMGADKKKTTAQWDSIFNTLADAGISGILMSADTMVLKKVIPVADDYGMQVHAWFWTMNRSDAKPEWLSVNRSGKSLAEEKAYVDYYKFMCPALPEVKEFIKSKMEELMAMEGLKGIHMDYIRYVDAILPVGLWKKYGLVQDHIMPEFDYGYHPRMRNLFSEKYGYDPLESKNPGADSLWLDFRLVELNKTVIGLRDFVNSSGLDITAAVFPTPRMSRKMVRQDWGTWGLDYYFPMVYHNFYNEDIEWIREVMEENKSALPPDSKIFCGLFLPALKKANDLTLTMKSAFKGGADGIAFFDLNSLSDNQLKQIKNFKKDSGR